MKGSSHDASITWLIDDAIARVRADRDRQILGASGDESLPVGQEARHDAPLHPATDADPAWPLAAYFTPAAGPLVTSQPLGQHIGTGWPHRLEPLENMAGDRSRFGGDLEVSPAGIALAVGSAVLGSRVFGRLAAHVVKGWHWYADHKWHRLAVNGAAALFLGAAGVGLL